MKKRDKIDWGALHERAPITKAEVRNKYERLRTYVVAPIVILLVVALLTICIA